MYSCSHKGQSFTAVLQDSVFSVPFTCRCSSEPGLVPCCSKFILCVAGCDDTSNRNKGSSQERWQKDLSSLIWLSTTIRGDNTHALRPFFKLISSLSRFFLSNPFYRAETVWRACSWGGEALLLKESARANLGLVVIIWASLWDHVSPKSFSVVTVTGYGADTVNKAGGKMTRLLFWQDQSSNASRSFAFAKRGEVRVSEPTFLDASIEKDPPLSSASLTAGNSHIGLSWRSAKWRSWDTRSFDWGVWCDCLSVPSMALRAGPQCVCRSQHCLIIGPRTDMTFEKKICALAFQCPPEVTTETDTHTCTRVIGCFSPPAGPQRDYCGSFLKRYVYTHTHTLMHAYVHMRAHAQLPLATVQVALSLINPHS